MELNYKKPLKADLSESLGKIEEGKNYFLIFKNDNDAQLDFKRQKQNYNFNSKNSGGLSTGGIVAIIIPSIVVLIAAIGVAIILNKRSYVSNAPMESPNNTIGISASSSNVVNK